MVARAISFIARATCYLVRAMTTIARAMLCSSAGTLEIEIYNWKWRAMTTHFKCASNCKCIDRHKDLFLFCPFFLVFSIFLLRHFPFCITAGTGVL